jgi:hypoxia-inducible factor prolyl hydroxylase
VVLGACDALVDAMKPHSESLGGVYERSDAMLSIYPGEGARFAKHIDNSTGDGRRLTLLMYLNPDWKKEDGGALRVFPKSRYAKPAGGGSGDIPAPTSTATAVDGDVAVDIYPVCGRCAMFYSADVAHEVGFLCCWPKTVF